MLHHRYIILFTLLMACLSVMGQVRDIVIKDGAYYSTASLPVDTVHNQSFEKDSIYLIVPRDVQIAYPDYNNRAQLIIWKSGRPIYALPITQYDSLSYVRMLQGDTLRTIFSQQAGSLPIYGKRPIVWQHGQVTVTDSAQVLANDVYQSVAQGNYANFIIQPTEIVRDTQYILCIRDTVYKVQDIYDDTDDVDSIPSVDTIPPTPGRRIGVFSVAADKQVSFSQGNLQYVQSTDTWQFASEQYAYIGKDCLHEGIVADTIDLFGWSTDNPLSKWGLVFVSNNDYYHGSFVDWGVNTISGDAPNTWRTLSIEEWKYLLKTRPTSNMRYTYGNINGTNGVLLFPDHWSGIDGISLTFSNQYQTNTLSLAQWELLENSGVVFLPSCGVYMGPYYNHPNTGLYWSSTAHPSNEGYALSIYITGSIQEWGNNRATNRSVRLVHDTIVPMPEPEYVDLGLSVKWATFNVGASKPEDYGDYFAWGETEPKETYSWANYKWCDGTENSLTKYCTNSQYGANGFTDNKTILDLTDDAAHVHWGENWRMPSDEEMTELREKCTWTWTTRNAIEGYNIEGPNGNSIFLPAAGFYFVDGYRSYENGDYWSTKATNTNGAYHLYFNSDHHSRSSSYRYFGFPIRPVYDDRPSKRIGVFSVGAGKKVSFSQGNLQYTQSTQTWQFAREQYDYLGEGNLNDGQLANRIDLFGWSANNTTAPFGVSMSTNNADYAGEFVDWGTNIIQGDAANTWRTLSKEEWEYLIKGRKNASNLRAAAQVNGVNGMILLPDDWECPEGIDFKAGYHTSKGSEYYAEYQQFTKEQWRELETTGAIFLPAAGMHDGNGIADIQAGGYYWSATDNGDTYAYTLISQSSGAYLTYDNRYDVRSVRLVHDTIVPPPAPCETFKVNGVTFNMMCVEGEMYDYKIAQTEVNQGLWEQVMGYNNSLFKGEYLPVEKVSWEECQTFIQKLNEMTGKHFRLPTEAEWEYAARGGKNSRGYTYAGSNSIDSVAWYQANSQEQTHTIATLMPNELGIYDMSGNVWEWCQDYYDASTQRVVRGGSFYDVASVCRISSRGGRDANYRSYIGLRLVLDERSTPPEPEYVDLGLSVKWATFNVGATSPEDYGDYFAWGETEPKEEYSWENYKWCDGDYTKLNKYCTKEQYGIVDNQTILQACDDAAHTKLGGNWRMPTMEECQELVNLCTWTWTTINGVNGHVITGPNGNTIFLPATGAITTSGLAHAGQSGYYWINSISTTNPYNANDIYNRPPNTEMDGSLPTYGINAYSRYIGRPIRPVYDDRPKSKIIWYTDEAIKGEGKNASLPDFCGWAYLHPQDEEATELNRRYQGKRINCIRVQVAQAGTFTVSVANRDRLESIFNIQTITLKDPSKEPQVYHLPQTIHLQKNQVLVFSCPTDDGKFYYSHTGDITYYDWVGRADKTVRITKTRKTLHIDAGYYCEEGDNCDTLAILEPEYVDLGLSVKWATFNVGATAPEEYGDYFAWGETEPKENYNWATYKWCDGTQNTMTKYNATDGKTILEPTDDAAQVHRGGKWRMPTKAECQELIDSCTWEWTTSNNINGYRVKGPNGNSIFLPAGGVRIGNASYAIGEFGYYWSSSLMIDSISEAHSIVFTPTSKSCDSDVLYRGRKIRPVYDDR